MFSPQQCISKFLKDPEDADMLYELLAWVRSAKGIMDQAEVDEFMSGLYARTSDGGKHRKGHDRKLSLKFKRHATVGETKSQMIS